MDGRKNNEQTKSKDWITYRIKIFMKYTLKSLKLQTNQNFVAFIIYDDKTKDLIKDRLNKYEDLPKNIIFIKKSKFRNRVLDYTSNNDFLYMTRLDTDDLYHKSYIQKLIDFKPKKDTKLLLSQHGYIYNSYKNTLVKLWFNGCPPFFTIIFTSAEMKEKVNKYRIVPYHNAFYYKYPNHEIIPGRNYLWHIHQQNYQTAAAYARYKNNDLRHVDIDNMITDKNEVNKILKNFK